MKHLIKAMLKEDISKTILLEELSLIIENEIGVGPALTKKLGNINKPYADKLLHFLKSDNISDKVKFDTIEYSDDDNKTISAYSKDRDGNTKKRKYNVGKLLKFLGVNLGEYKGYELEELIAHLKKGTTEDFKIVDGEKILWAYHCDNYDEGENMGSCMRYASAQSYLELYTENPDEVKCLVLLNPSNGKVRGRALLWKTDDGETFMDRVYMTNNQYKNLFLQYAEQHGYTTRSGSEVSLSEWDFEEYPYLDHFQYLNKETGKLMSDGDGDTETMKLDSTTGGAVEADTVHIEYGDHEGENIHEDEAVYLSYETADGHVEGFAHEDDCFYGNDGMYLNDDGYKLYDNSYAFKYDYDMMVVEITEGLHQGEYAYYEDCYVLYPDHYGDEEYVLNRGTDVAELYDDHYDYSYALLEDAIELNDEWYNGAYGMRNDAVRLFDKKYGEDEFALRDDATEIKLKDIGDTWVMDDDLDEFDELRIETTNKELIKNLVQEAFIKLKK